MERMVVARPMSASRLPPMEGLDTIASMPDVGDAPEAPQDPEGSLNEQEEEEEQEEPAPEPEVGRCRLTLANPS